MTPAAHWIKIDEINPWKRNPKKHDKKDISEARESLRRFGFCAPMVHWPQQNLLVAGHARMAAFKSILQEDPELSAEQNKILRSSLQGPTIRHVPVRQRDFDSLAEAEAYALRDNNDFGVKDDVLLGEIVRDLAASGTSVSDLGFSEAELERMFRVTGQDLAGDQSLLVKDEWLIIVECVSDADQLSTIDRLSALGLRLRAM